MVTRYALLPLSGFALTLGVSACLELQAGIPRPSTQPYSSTAASSSNSIIGCESLLNSFCDALYAPGANGNLQIRTSRQPVEILSGKSPTGLSAPYSEYSQARLAGRNRFSADFQKALLKHGFFDRLRTLLTTVPESQLPNSVGRFEIEKAWEAAQLEVELSRMEPLFRKYYDPGIDELPLELKVERERLHLELLSEIAEAVWSGHPRWKEVTRQFTDLKSRFVETIGRLKVSASVRRKWIQRVNSVALVLPGTLRDPELLLEENEECLQGAFNSYYSTVDNTLTICAGDFLAGGALFNLAHELGHAIDLQSDQEDFRANSKMGLRLADLTEKTCRSGTFTCADWRAFKKDFRRLLGSFRGFRPELREFQKCLQRRMPSKRITEGELKRQAEEEVSKRFSSMAESGLFLRVINREIPMKDGTWLENRNYLDPCSYFPWYGGKKDGAPRVPPGDPIHSLLFFSSEYLCGVGDASSRFRTALGESKRMSEELEEAILRMEAEFSDRDELAREGYASSPVERFADVLGSYALANALRAIPTKWERRNLFLASNAWACSEPSLKRLFPIEGSIEEDIIYDIHTDGNERRREILAQPVREALGCYKDFDFHECRLELSPKR